MSLLDSDAEELKRNSNSDTGTGRKVNKSGLGAFKSISKISSLTAKYRNNKTDVEQSRGTNVDRGDLKHSSEKPSSIKPGSNEPTSKHGDYNAIANMNQVQNNLVQITKVDNDLAISTVSEVEINYEQKIISDQVNQVLPTIDTKTGSEISTHKIESTKHSSSELGSAEPDIISGAFKNKTKQDKNFIDAEIHEPSSTEPGSTYIESNQLNQVQKDIVQVNQVCNTKSDDIVKTTSNNEPENITPAIITHLNQVKKSIQEYEQKDNFTKPSSRELGSEDSLFKVTSTESLNNRETNKAQMNQVPMNQVNFINETLIESGSNEPGSGELGRLIEYNSPHNIQTENSDHYKTTDIIDFKHDSFELGSNETEVNQVQQHSNNDFDNSIILKPSSEKHQNLVHAIDTKTGAEISTHKIESTKYDSFELGSAEPDIIPGVFKRKTEVTLEAQITSKFHGAKNNHNANEPGSDEPILNQVQGYVEQKRGTNNYNAGQSQIEDNLNPIDSIMSLPRSQRLILDFLFKICVWNNSLITPPINKKYISKETGLNEGTLITALKRLMKKRYILTHKYKDGRTGWTQYKISEVSYKELFLIQQSSVNFNKQYSNHRLDKQSEGDAAKLTKIQPNPVKATWFKDLDFSPVRPISALFVNVTIRDAVQENLTPDIVQEFINRFTSWVATQGKISSPIGIFCDKLKELVKEGDSAVLSCLTEAERAAEVEFLIHAEKAKTELDAAIKAQAIKLKSDSDLKFEEGLAGWIQSSPKEEFKKLFPFLDKIDPNSEAYKESIRSYFREKVWNNEDIS